MIARLMTAGCRLGVAFVCGVAFLIGPSAPTPASADHPVAGDDPPAAATAPVIVSMNMHNRSTNMMIRETRPQTRAATFLNPPTLTGGIQLQWGDGDHLLLIGASPQEPLHLGTFTSLKTATKGSEFRDVVVGFQSFGFDNRGGRIEVLDLAATPTGRLTRFDILFDMSDVTDADDTIGELRMNEPDAVPGLSPTAQQFHWPRVAIGGPAFLVADSITNTTSTPVAVGRAAVTGGATKDYTVRSDTCSDHVLGAGAACAVTIAYRPTAPGPRVSSLVIPAGRQALRIGLTGNTRLGVSTLTTSGSAWINGGHTYTFGPLIGSGFGKFTNVSPEHEYYWTGDPESRSTRLNGLDVTLTSTAGPVRVGTYKTNPEKHSNVTIDVTEFYQSCAPTHGTVTVNAFKLNSDGQPNFADITFDQTCRPQVYKGSPGSLRGRLLYEARRDVVAPSAPSRLTVTGHRVHWKRSSARDLSTTIVRVDTGGRATPTTGFPVASGSTGSATLPILRRGQTYRVAAFSVDRAGNVSKPVTRSFTY